MAQTKNLGDIKLSQTVFFLCDMQERFRPAIKYFDDIVEVAKRLVNVDRFNVKGVHNHWMGGVVSVFELKGRFLFSFLISQTYYAEYHTYMLCL